MLNTDLLPEPETIRERLARNYREARILRSLLRLARKAQTDLAEHRHAYAAHEARQRPRGTEAAK